MLALPDWQGVVYIGLVEAALFAAIVVLYLRRQRAPRACGLGVIGFGALMLFNAIVVVLSPRFMYHVANGDTVALLMWQYQVLSLTSAAVHTVVIGVVTAAILTDRTPAREGDD